MPDFVRLSTAIIALSSGKEAKKKYERLKHKGNSVFSAETAVKILFSCFFFFSFLHLAAGDAVGCGVNGSSK